MVKVNQDEIKQLKKEIHYLTNSFKKIDEKTKHLIQQIEINEQELETTRESKNETIAQQFHYIRHLEKELKKGQKSLQRLKNSRQQLFQEFKELSQNFKELKSKNYKLSSKEKKLSNKLGKQIRNLQRLSQSKDNSLVKLKNELNQAIGILKDDITRLEYKLEARTDQRDKAREKLKKLKEKQEILKIVAEKKKVSWALIKYTPPLHNEAEENDYQEINDTSNSLVEAIADTQNHLGVEDITQISTTHKLPEKKTLGDLIEFYHNPPQNFIPNNNNNHICPKTCSEAYHVQLQQEVVKQLNTHLGLELKQPTLNQMINHLNKLLKAPVEEVKPIQPVIIQEGENLTEIKQTSLYFLETIFSTLPIEVKTQIWQAESYFQVSQIEKNLLQTHLNQQEQNKHLLETENESLKDLQKGLITGLILKGLLIIWILFKIGKNKKRNKRLK